MIDTLIMMDDNKPTKLFKSQVILRKKAENSSFMPSYEFDTKKVLFKAGCILLDVMH